MLLPLLLLSQLWADLWCRGRPLHRGELQPKPWELLQLASFIRWWKCFLQHPHEWLQLHCVGLWGLFSLWKVMKLYGVQGVWECRRVIANRVFNCMVLGTIGGMCHVLRRRWAIQLIMVICGHMEKLRRVIGYWDLREERETYGYVLIWRDERINETVGFCYGGQVWGVES